MKASTLSPAEIFGNQIRYVVPLYQRPYVWSLEAQWQLLWEDIRTLAERVLEAPTVYGAPPVPPHFLGAIVIDQLPGPVQYIGARSVIDGQQRLTTLQLLLDAARAVVAEHGDPIDASALRVIVENDGALAANADHAFKVWPTDRDQEAFRTAMSDGPRPSGDLAKSKIASCHAYFLQVVREWSQVDESSPQAKQRLAALTTALREKLRLVVIDLEPGDNAQVIFETLNHRGAPLLAADLVKNLLFQVAAAQGLDVETLYSSHWRALDGEYWRQMVARGRRFEPRIDVFMQRWLVMNLRKDVPTDRVFTEFRDSILAKHDANIASLFKEIAADAEAHKAWEKLPEDSVPGRFHYRVIRALDTQVVAPVFLWLTRHRSEEMPDEQRDLALRSIESWLVRRALIRATSKDYNNAMIDLLRALDLGGPAAAGDTTEQFLKDQSAESRYWPSNERVAAALADERIYKTMTRPRLRMILEVLEDDLRDPEEGQHAPRGLTIEHVMPFAWREHWGDGVVDDPVAAQRRDRLVQTLGNLTLVTGGLNPALSNRPWTDAEAVDRGLGSKGKRDYLLERSALKLNAALVHQNQALWSEERIQQRTKDLSDRLCAIWPCPADAVQPAGTAAAPVPVPELPEEQDIQAWSVDQQDVALAARIWVALNPTSRDLLRVLIKDAPQPFAAPDLARQLDIEDDPSGIDGQVARTAEAAARLGREPPVSLIEGDPLSYRMEEVVAKTFEAAFHSASEQSVGSLTEDGTVVQPQPASGRRSVPKHVLEVFAGYPDDAELTLGQIAAAASTNYAAKEISQGAISAALNRNGIEGVEVVPGSSPVRARRSMAPGMDVG